GVVELLQGWKGGIDQHVDDEVSQEAWHSLRQLWALRDPALKVVDLRRRIETERDQVVGADEQVVLVKGDLVAVPVGLEDDREVVVVVLVDLRPLVLVLDVLDGQRMELECVLEHVEVLIVGRLDVKPEAFLVSLLEAPLDLDVTGVLDVPINGEELSHPWAC